ncbi:hypothetical protein [Botryobacter ruber]|uniref:hypothetical protein n=1 Tax=Botryobacter ruber TaxID=2171629 RepID=UPI000E0AC919|nr:hypothetical protein [Botryobacter ruber]
MIQLIFNFTVANEMYKDRYQTDQKRATQAYTQDGWVKRNYLRDFAQIVSSSEAHKTGQEKEPGFVLQQQSWVPWPTLRSLLK